MAQIALAGGGTGGHVYPALAIGDALRARGHAVVLFGDPGRLEGRVAPQRGYALTAVSASQFPRGGGVVARLRFGLRLVADVVAARRQLRAAGVDAVLGVGGYLAAPTVLAAWTLGLPVVVHEANAVPGLANRLCAQVADRVLLTFEGTRRFLRHPSRAVQVGVPVSASVAQGDRAAAAARYGLDPSRTTVLIVGGSLGAARLNDLAVHLASDPARDVQLLHLSGPRYADAVRASLPANVRDHVLVAYEDRMADAYAVADVVVCRAGSGTLAELALVGLPALLVPSPHVTDDHQTANARALEAQGAAQVLVEDGWEDASAAAAVLALARDVAARARMAEAMRATARPDAAERAADVVEAALGRAVGAGRDTSAGEGS